MKIWILGVQKRSRSRTMYRATNDKIEKMLKLIHLIQFRVNLPGVAMPAILTTAVNYYIYDLGEQSFRLIVPLA